LHRYYIGKVSVPIQELCGDIAKAALGIPSFTCTPDQFPDLMGATINKRNLNEWAAERGIALARS
jgi:hypothetical protein